MACTLRLRWCTLTRAPALGFPSCACADSASALRHALARTVRLRRSAYVLLRPGARMFSSFLSLPGLSP